MSLNSKRSFLYLIFILAFISLILQLKPEIVENKAVKIPRNVVISAYFDYKVDPQRDAKVADVFSYSLKWAESLYNNRLEGVLLTNVKNQSAANFLKQLGIELVSVDMESPLIKDNMNVTTNDMKFFAVSDWINNHLDEFNYVLVTDLWDVEVLKDPFPFMEGYDKSLEEVQLYFGSENNFDRNWIGQQWQDCFPEPFPDRFLKRRFYNSGLIAGNILIIREFLKSVCIEIKRAQHKSCCDMVASWSALDKYEGRTFTGYPLHTEFRKNQYENGALLKHK